MTIAIIAAIFAGCVCGTIGAICATEFFKSIKTVDELAKFEENLDRYAEALGQRHL